MATSSRKARFSFKKREKPKIASIYVEGLFGKYTFPEIDFSKSGEGNSNLVIFYGDNGIGKTTILQLVYAMLSSEGNSGHRGYLGRTKYKQVSIKFDDGHEVSSKKKDPKDTSYSLSISGPSVSFSHKIQLDETSKASMTLNPSLKEYLSLVENIFPELMFVNDERRISSSYFDWWPSQEFQFTQRGKAEPRGPDLRLTAPLEPILSTVENMFNARALRDVASSNVDIGQVYLDIAKTLSKSNKKTESDVSTEFIINRISLIEEHVQSYGEFSLIQGEAISAIRELLSNAGPSYIPQLIDVLSPYVSSIEKRMEATRNVSKQISTYIRGVNSFLNRKAMQFKVGEPIIFLDDGGDAIPYGSLSSGERHLLFLCSSAMLSNISRSIIIIDEPEISLNYKWQQTLIETLMSISGGNSQFLIASHSFEIISHFRNDTFSLQPM